MAVAEWVRLRTGRDPAARWRGLYCDARSRLDLLKRERGGFLSLMSAGALACRLDQTANPVEGDVGLIRVAGAERSFAGGHVGAIMLAGEFWWTPQPNGVLIVKSPVARLVVAWCVP